MLYIGYLLVLMTLLLYGKPYMASVVILFITWQVVSSGWYQWLV